MITNHVSQFTRFRQFLKEACKVLGELSRFIKEVAIFLAELAALILVVYLIATHTKESLGQHQNGSQPSVNQSTSP